MIPKTDSGADWLAEHIYTMLASLQERGFSREESISFIVAMLRDES